VTPTRLRNLSLALAATLWACGSWAAAQVGTSITATKHNLSASGPGPIKVAGAEEVCKFCHTPHASNPIAPLWNRSDPGTYYKTYKSSTLVANVGQPTGSSRLCLSCHDGTIALTQTYNARGGPPGTVFLSASDRGYLGTDLSVDHPISFVYDSSLAVAQRQLLDPAALPVALKLDDEHRLQCTTCHDPHDNRFGKFLTMSNAESATCRTCHLMNGWTVSAHATSSASLAGATRDKWSNITAGSVRQASCEACHRPHNAGGRERLMRREAEEDNCLSCHDGSVARGNIAAELTKISIHDVRATTGVHSPAEKASGMTKHVECTDCHDPHRAAAGTAVAPHIRPSTRGATGITGADTTLIEATYEFQICYKCHTGTATVRSPLISRVISNADLSQKLAPVNPSYHPVEASGKSTNVPSLLQPLKTTSIIYCTNCHNSDSIAQGTRGPHGSPYRPLLARNYALIDNTVESPTAYALCYGCHNRNSILANQSFKLHKLHIVDKKTPCYLCHDPHGISATQGTTRNNVHLINFNNTAVLPFNKTGPVYVSRGTNRGSCTLRCHNFNHSNLSYGP
jgi:predicted CXXCH cytochrome family protein